MQREESRGQEEVSRHDGKEETLSKEAVPSEDGRKGKSKCACVSVKEKQCWS